ncbi:hypothetical protein F2Q68_00026186 [Brassica cretica]|uniref:Uncharacterized protein n=2 Tax=Brassica cretica TaxID=69181 RepID=A0A8S9I9Y6_BRACR|nr:hypothetical protein F2Q68_00026186 [Brassica cretica]KAF3575699.1 hypothetical protein DY000_02032367 [Brassica cretica]
METSINVGNNRLAAPGGINRQSVPLFCLIVPRGETPILAIFFTLLPSALRSTPDLK